MLNTIQPQEVAQVALLQHIHLVIGIFILIESNAHIRTIQNVHAIIHAKVYLIFNAEIQVN